MGSMTLNPLHTAGDLNMKEWLTPLDLTSDDFHSHGAEVKVGLDPFAKCVLDVTGNYARAH